MTIEYDAPRAERRTIKVLVSFLGETRTDLSVTCAIDGHLVEPSIHAAEAGHRWEIEQTWGGAPDA